MQNFYDNQSTTDKAEDTNPDVERHDELFLMSGNEGPVYGSLQGENTLDGERVKTRMGSSY